MTQCVICARDAEHGYLDVGCFTRLASMLRDIEDEYAVVETMPSMAMSVEFGGGGLASERSPVVLDAIVARDSRRGLMRWSSADDDLKAFDPWGLDNTASVLETLHSRARTVREDLEITPPQAITVSGERDLLTRQLKWIARQPWVDEMFKEIRELLGQLQRTNKTQPDRPEGICFQPAYESTCGGRIWRRTQQRVVDSTTGRRKVEVADGAAYCDRCHVTWDGPELARLALILEQQAAERARPKTEDGRRMLTAPELVAKGYVSSVSNVRVGAHRRGVSAVNGHYDPEWFTDKATA